MLAEMMKYKELLYFLVHKELRVKYRNSFFGFFWSLLEPLGLMVIYTVVFSYILGVDGRGGITIERYPLFILSGLIPWTFFNNAIRGGTRALSSNASLIKKVYFPREIFPTTILLSNLVNFFPAFGLVIVAALAVGHTIYWDMLLLLPFFILVQSVFTMACILLVSILNVYYRDVEFISNLVLRAWMYMCPIIYPIQFVMQSDNELVRQLADLYLLNPMAVIISLYHSILYGDSHMVGMEWILYTIAVTIAFCFISWKIFRRLNDRVGEVI